MTTWVWIFAALASAGTAVFGSATAVYGGYIRGICAAISTGALIVCVFILIHSGF